MFTCKLSCICVLVDSDFVRTQFNESFARRLLIFLPQTESLGVVIFVEDFLTNHNLRFELEFTIQQLYWFCNKFMLDLLRLGLFIIFNVSDHFLLWLKLIFIVVDSCRCSQVNSQLTFVLKLTYQSRWIKIIGCYFCWLDSPVNTHRRLYLSWRHNVAFSCSIVGLGCSVIRLDCLSWPRELSDLFFKWDIEFDGVGNPCCLDPLALDLLDLKLL